VTLGRASRRLCYRLVAVSADRSAVGAARPDRGSRQVVRSRAGLSSVSPPAASRSLGAGLTASVLDLVSGAEHLDSEVGRGGGHPVQRSSNCSMPFSTRVGIVAGVFVLPVRMVIREGRDWCVAAREVSKV
jgi:hypothetical protein